MTTILTDLTPEAVESYRENGYLVLPNVLSPGELKKLREVTKEFAEAAVQPDADHNVMDIGFYNGNAYLRRIKSPHLHHPAYAAVMRHPRILNAVSGLIGPDIRLYGTKLNLKLPAGVGTGDAIQWHQDWAFYPHTNDNLLSVGVLLDDMTDSNGPLLAVPGSQYGEVYDHHTDGVFAGALDFEPIRAQLEKAHRLTASAGSITLHHVRVVHASGPNRSSSARRIIFQNYAAADAWPLVGCGAPGDGHVCPGSDFNHYKSLIVQGEHREARIAEVPVRLPLPGSKNTSSVFTTQSASRASYFD